MESKKKLRDARKKLRHVCNNFCCTNPRHKDVHISKDGRMYVPTNRRIKDVIAKAGIEME